MKKSLIDLQAELATEEEKLKIFERELDEILDNKTTGGIGVNFGYLINPSDYSRSDICENGSSMYSLACSSIKNDIEKTKRKILKISKQIAKIKSLNSPKQFGE